MSDGGFNLFTKLDDCDTALAFIDNNAIFKQTVYGYAIAGDTGIFLGRPVELDYTCTYQTEYNTDGDSIIVANVEATTNRYGSGQFEFDVDFYTDATFATKSTHHDIITVGEQVYFSVSSVNLPASVSFSVTDCTITNTQTEMSYYIIEHFCPDRYTNTHFMSDNVQKQSLNMSYQAFKFTGVDGESEEILSCRVIVCNDNDGDNSCTAQPSCADGRKRRSAKEFAVSKVFQIKKGYTMKLNV